MSELNQTEDFARSIGSALDQMRYVLEHLEGQLAEVKMQHAWCLRLIARLEEGRLLPWALDDAEELLREVRRFLKAVMR